MISVYYRKLQLGYSAALIFLVANLYPANVFGQNGLKDRYNFWTIGDTVKLGHRNFTTPVHLTGTGLDARIYFTSSDFVYDVDFSYSRISSPIDFRWCDFESEAKFYHVHFDSVDFYGATFDTTASFSDIHCYKFCNFYGVDFNSRAYFHDAEFGSVVDFTWAKFKTEAYFQGAHFKSKTLFQHTYFFDEADFTETVFDSAANFSNAYFGFSTDDWGAWFEETKFKSEVSFDSAHFGAEANFIDVLFDSIVDFSNADFADGVYFERVQFDSVVRFNGAHLNGYSGFDMLPKHLDLSNVRIDNTILDLYSSKVDSSQKYCLINLVNADIKNIRLRYKNFKLYFPPNTEWAIKENVYTLLISQTRADGFIESLEVLDTEYREAKYLKGPDGPKSFRNFIDKKWWGYGYRKDYILKNTFGLFLLFSLVNIFLLKGLLEKVYTIERIKNAVLNTPHKGIKHFLIKIYYSILYTGLVFFGIKFTVENLHYSTELGIKKIAGMLYFILIYISGLLCLGYLTNYIITI